jgi:multiple sugar transport system substrate-binding protein
MTRKKSRRDFLKASVAVTAGTLLAACAPSQATNPPNSSGQTPQANAPTAPTKKIVFSTYVWSNFEEAMTGILDKWKEETPNVDYEAQFVPQTIDYWAKVQTQVASGTPPDCGMADYGRLVSYAKNGTLKNITSYITGSSFPIDKTIPAASAQYRWAEGSFDSGSTGGDYFGLPSDAQSQIFVYNKKMFDDAGVAYPTDDWTWDDMLAAAKKITKADQNIWGMAAIPNYILFKGDFVWSAGGALHSPDFTKSMLTDPGTVEAYKWNWDLLYTHKVAPLPSGNADQQNSFMSGQVAMYVEGVWWITDFVNGIKDFEWDVALLPKHPRTGKRTTTVESDGWWVYKGAKDPDTAWNLISYMAKPSGQQLFISANDCIPSTYQDIATKWYGATPPPSKMKILDNINQDSAKVDFTYFEFGTITNAVWPIIDKAFADGTDITEALTNADQVMNEELTKAMELMKS